jgi:hypothetical protein
MSRAHLECADWPIVVIKMPVEATAQDIDDHFAELSALLTSRAGRMVAVVDGTEATGLGSAHRARVAAGVLGIVARYGSRIAGVAYVVPSPLLRGVITAIHWLVGVPFPKAIIADSCCTRRPSPACRLTPAIEIRRTKF